MVGTLQLLFLAVMPLAVLGGESVLPVDPKTTDGAVAFGEGTSYSAKNIWSDEHPGYAVQTGYEGYLIPAEPPTLKELIRSIGIFTALPILGQVTLDILVKGAVVVLSLGTVISVGLILTYLLCACTSVCHLNFNIFDKFHRLDRKSMRSLINADTINTAADFLSRAMAKYGDSGKKTRSPSSL